MLVDRVLLFSSVDITITVIIASNMPIIAWKPPMYNSPSPNGNVPAIHISNAANTAAKNMAVHDAMPIDHHLCLPKIPFPFNIPSGSHVRFIKCFPTIVPYKAATYSHIDDVGSHSCYSSISKEYSLYH